MLQDFLSVSDHFGTLCIKGLSHFSFRSHKVLQLCPWNLGSNVEKSWQFVDNYWRENGNLIVKIWLTFIEINISDKKTCSKRKKHDFKSMCTKLHLSLMKKHAYLDNGLFFPIDMFSNINCWIISSLARSPV